jgi:hypothetical protein
MANCAQRIFNFQESDVPSGGIQPPSPNRVPFMTFGNMGTQKIEVSIASAVNSEGFKS